MKVGRLYHVLEVRARLTSSIEARALGMLTRQDPQVHIGAARTLLHSDEEQGSKVPGDALCCQAPVKEWHGSWM